VIDRPLRDLGTFSYSGLDEISGDDLLPSPPVVSSGRGLNFFSWCRCMLRHTRSVQIGILMLLAYSHN
jgi:hypothetical protein